LYEPIRAALLNVMGDFFTALDSFGALLFGGALAMIAFSHRELQAARLMLVAGTAMTVIRWSTWSFTTDAPWQMRALIGAILGSAMLALLPALWQWSLERGKTATRPASPSTASSPTQVPITEPKAVIQQPRAEPAPAVLLPPRDIATKIGVLDRAYVILNDFAHPINEGHQLQSRWLSELREASVASYVHELEKLRDRYLDLSRQLSRLREQYKSHAEIFELLQQPFHDSFSAAIDEFIGTIKKFQRDAPNNYDEIITPHSGALLKALGDIANWRSKTMSAISQQRRAL
jgi:hypothetical protein